MEKKTFSFGHCPNHLNPPRLDKHGSLLNRPTSDDKSKGERQIETNGAACHLVRCTLQHQWRQTFLTGWDILSFQEWWIAFAFTLYLGGYVIFITVKVLSSISFNLNLYKRVHPIECLEQITFKFMRNNRAMLTFLFVNQVSVQIKISFGVSRNRKWVPAHGDDFQAANICAWWELRMMIRI